MTYPHPWPNRPSPTASCQARAGVGKGQHTAAATADPGRCWAGAMHARAGSACSPPMQQLERVGGDARVGVEEQDVGTVQVDGLEPRFTAAANPRLAPGSR